MDLFHLILNSFLFGCQWILHGYFKCVREVRQGDPLSPLLSYFAEETFSRGILKLVLDRSLKLMMGKKHLLFPTHILYAYDILIFYKGTKFNTQVLISLFFNYVRALGQVFSSSKSTILFVVIVW